MPNGEFDKNVIIFGADKSNSVYTDTKKKNILIHCEGPRQGLDARYYIKKIIQSILQSMINIFV